MSQRVMVVTCAEPDATAFLRALPLAQLEETTLVATSDVVDAARRHTTPAGTCIIGGPATFADVRRLLSAPGAHITVVVAPDPWGPVNGKGFVRARQALPFILPDVRLDAIELEHGGERGRMRRGITRAAFTRWIRRREVAYLADHAVQLGVARRDGYGLSPALVALAVARLSLAPVMSAITLVRVLPFIARTEVRARRLGQGRR